MTWVRPKQKSSWASDKLSWLKVHNLGGYAHVFNEPTQTIKVRRTFTAGGYFWGHMINYTPLCPYTELFWSSLS